MAVTNVRFVQMLSGPRPDEADPASQLQLRNQRRAGLLAAHRRNETIASVWMRRPTTTSEIDRDGLQRFAILLGSTGRFPPRDEGAAGLEAPVLHPPGARGTEVVDHTVLGALRGLTWSALAGSFEASVSVTPDHEPTARLPLDDVVGHLDVGPFALVVLARPITDQERVASVRQVETAHRQVRNADRVGDDARRDEAQRWHEELHHAAAIGTWAVRVLVGAASAQRVDEVAAVLASAVASPASAYRLTPSAAVAKLELWVPPLTDDSLAARASDVFIASSHFLDLVVRTPDVELSGWRLVPPHAFDITQEGDPEVLLGSTPTDDVVDLGRTLDAARRSAGRFLVQERSITRHTFVCGATGSGKSQTVRRLLEELSATKTPWLVIEPAKAEYADALARRVADRAAADQGVHVIRIGDPSVPPLLLNPLCPQEGFPLQTHVDLVQALFLAAFEGHEPFPQVLAEALRVAYTDLGWSLATGRHRSDQGDGPVAARYPTLADLQDAAMRVVDGLGYGAEMQGNVRGFIKVRLNSLQLGSAGRFFVGGYPIDIAALLEHQVVLEAELLGSDVDKAFVMGTLLMAVYEHLVTQGPSGGLKHVTVIEEAHRLLRRPDPGGGVGAHAVETFAALLAEVRAYGEGLVVAEQIPTKVIPDVIKNTSQRIVHRLPALDDRELVGSSMNLTPAQMEAVVSLAPGQAAAFTDGMDHATMVAIHDRTAVENEGTATADAHTLPFVKPIPLPGDVHVCRRARCTTRRLEDAAKIIDGRPLLSLWMECLVITWLGGTEAARPRTDLLEAAPTWVPVDLRPCVAALLAESVVRTRGGVDPNLDLVAGAMRAAAALLQGDRTGADWRSPVAPRSTVAEIKGAEVLSPGHSKPSRAVWGLATAVVAAGTLGNGERARRAFALVSDVDASVVDPAWLPPAQVAP